MEQHIISAPVVGVLMSGYTIIFNLFSECEVTFLYIFSTRFSNFVCGKLKNLRLLEVHILDAVISMSNILKLKLVSMH